MSDFIKKAYNRVMLSGYATPKTKSNGKTTSPFICPICEKPSCYIFDNGPFALICNRCNNCGATTKTLDLFPDLKTNFDRDFPASKTDADRPAREYLKSRGIGKAQCGLTFRYLKNARKTGSGAILFSISYDDKGKLIENGRLFNPPKGEGKTHNIGSTTGRYWKHPGITYDPNQQTFFTEGVINALSIIEMGQQAIAVLSSGQDPSKLKLDDYNNKVLAFDNDEAGRSACRKWKKKFPEAGIMLCDPGEDWNNLLQRWPPGSFKERFIEHSPRFRTNGELAIAESAAQYADVYYKSFGYPPALFSFNKETYFASLKSARSGDQEPYVSVSRCLRGTIKTLSFIIDKTNPSRPEYLYNLEVKASQQGRRPVEVIATGKNIAAPRNINEFLLSAAKIPWEGDSKAATALQSLITGDKTAPEITQLSITGYQPESKTYVFTKWAINTHGNLVEPDAWGRFTIAYNQSCRPPEHGEGKSITPAKITNQRLQEIYWIIYEAWGVNGIISLSWVVASWFVNQIKAQIGFFPFLSIHGDPASGKSALVTVLNNIQGIDGEGLPINQLNSKKGSIRTIGQLSGMFTSLLEDNERNERGFDYSIILTAYNKGPLQVQAAFSNDLQTRTNYFLGSLLFCQNSEPFVSKAERQRVISLLFRSELITDESRTAYEQLMSIQKNEIAGLIQQTLIARNFFESNWHKEYEKARTDLSPMTERRILDNHALLLAFYRLFCRCFSLKDNDAIAEEIKNIGQCKCISSSLRQTTIADHFFELIDTIEEEKAATAYHIDSDKKMIMVNLPRTENHLRNKGFSFQANESLQQALQQHPSFIRNGLTYRFPRDPETDSSGKKKVRKVWVFSLDWFEKNSKTDIENQNATLATRIKHD